MEVGGVKFMTNYVGLFQQKKIAKTGNVQPI